MGKLLTDLEKKFMQDSFVALESRKLYTYS